MISFAQLCASSFHGEDTSEMLVDIDVGVAESIIKSLSMFIQRDDWIINDQDNWQSLESLFY